MNFIVGFFLPALIGTINRNISNPSQRFWASMVICALVGIIVNFLEHDGFVGYLGYSFVQVADSLGESILIMTGATKLSYEAFWNNESISKVVPDTVLKNETVLEKLDLKSIEK